MEKKELVEWTGYFLRHKDIIKQEIVNIKPAEDFDLVVEKKDKKAFVCIALQLKNIEVFLKKITPNKDEFILVLLNTKHNLEQVKKVWEIISIHKNLLIVFSNPDAKTTDTKWIIKPYVHSLISEKKAISSGLNALFESIESA